MQILLRKGSLVTGGTSAAFALHPLVAHGLTLRIAQAVLRLGTVAIGAGRALLRSGTSLDGLLPTLLIYGDGNGSINLTLLVSEDLIPKTTFHIIQIDLLDADCPVHGLGLVAGIVGDVVWDTPHSIALLDRLTDSNAIAEIYNTAEGMVRCPNAVSWRRIRPGVGSAKLSTGSLLDHLLDIGLIMLLLVVLKLEHLIIGIALVTVTHDAS